MLEKKVANELSAIERTQLFQLLKDRAKHGQDVQGVMRVDKTVRALDPHIDSGTMADVTAWEHYKKDLTTAARLAKEAAPTVALTYLKNPNNLHFISYARTKKDLPEWAGIFKGDDVDPAIVTAFRQDLEHRYWQNRKQHPLKAIGGYLARPAITALLVLGGSVALYFGVIEKRIESKVQDQVQHVEANMNGIQQNIDAKVKQFKQEQGIKHYLPHIRKEVESVLGEYESRVTDPERIIEGIVTYAQNNPDKLRETGIPRRIIKELLNDQDLVDELGEKLGESVRKGFLGG